MSDLNTVAIIGNLVHNPELKHTQTGKAVCSFRLACNSGYGDKQETLFIGVETWNKNAENIAQYCAQGSKIAIQGCLKENKWESREGQKRTEIRITAFLVQFLSHKAQDKPSANPSKPPAQTQGAQPNYNVENEIPF